jgi:hypothetical protein
MEKEEEERERKSTKGPMYKVMSVTKGLPEAHVFVVLLYKMELKSNYFRLATRKCFLMKCIINLYAMVSQIQFLP